jgi:cytochrome c biogenesis protein
MNQTARSAAVRLNNDPLHDAEGAELALPVGDIFERLWHLFISMRTGLALMLGIAVLTLFGAVVVQAPAGLAGDAGAYAAWLEGVRPKYGGWTAVLDLLGLFNVFGSLLFRSLVLLLATSILACSVNRAPRLWRQAVHPRVAAGPTFFDHVRLSGEVAAEGDEGEALQALQGELARRRFRTIVVHDASGIAVYADRFRWGPFGTVIAHLSLIVIMAGAVLGATGFRDEGFAIAVGSTVPIGNGTNLEVKATSFTDSYYENGSPADYASHLVLYENGVQVAERTIRVNDPLRYGDVKLFQSFYGPAADILVKDTSGATLYQDGVPLLWSSNDGTKMIGQFTVQSRDLTIYVIGVASGRVDAGIKPGQVQIEIFQGSNTEVPVGLQVVDPGVPTTIAGLELTFLRERQYTGLIVARDPGGPLVWLGAILLVLGVMLVFFFPARRIWARISSAASGSRIQVAALASHDVTFETAFRNLIDDVDRAARGPEAS